VTSRPSPNFNRRDRGELLREFTHCDVDRNPTRHAALLLELERAAAIDPASPAPTPAPPGQAA
jgi:hypothetical protein